jgi:hypothetical protein
MILEKIQDDGTIPVITGWMPWFFWINRGWKTIETRLHGHFDKFKGCTIGIHVGKKWDKDWIESAGFFLTQDKFGTTQDIYSSRHNEGEGCIICTAFVNDVRICGPEDSNAAMIDCGIRVRHGLFLTNIRPVEHIPLIGQRGPQYIPFSQIIYK